MHGGRGGQFYSLAAAAMYATLERLQSSAVGQQPPNVPTNLIPLAPSCPGLISHSLVKHRSEERVAGTAESVLGEELAQLLVDT